jgi:2-dehydropantoate 2-reductase
MEIRKISIIGLGAIGIMYADYISGMLPEADLRIVADEGRIQRYQKQGIYCNGKQCHFAYLTDTEENPADLLIFAVKFGQLEAAIRSAAHQVGENTIILSTLNGITSEEYLAEAFGEDRVLLCTVQGMDAVKEDNQMTYHHMGYVCVGTRDGKPSPYLAAVTAFFDRIKLPYRLPEDMQRQLWNKLLLNVGVNQAVAVYETNYGGVQKDGEARDIMLQAMKEVINVAQAKKINLSEEDITNWIGVINSLDPDGKPSMRQDTQVHRSTEVELFSGTINRLGKEYGVATPVNEMLYRRIKEMEA